MKQQIIDLWKTSFDDTDDFMDLYFNRVYKDEYTSVIRKNGQIISALQVLPYEMTFCGTTIPMGYVCGVCTLPSERGKGWMKQLMQQAIEEMNHNNYAIATLIPASAWLFDYYKHVEFTNAFDYSLEEHHRDAIPDHNRAIQIISQNELSPDTLYTYFDAKQRQRNCAVIHTACGFETIRKDILLDKGGLWMAFRDEKPAGMALAVPTDDKVFIKELFYEDTDLKNALIQFVLNHFNSDTVTVRIAPVPLHSIPYGMARILDKRRMTDLYLSFHTQANGSDFENTDIPTLTQALLQYQQRNAYISLMLD